LNPFFEENGFKSKDAIKNLGSSFIYICIFALVLLLLPFLAFLSKFSKRFSLLYQWMKDILIWNGFFAFIMS
jgi:hypothetical protein